MYRSTNSAAFASPSTNSATSASVPRLGRSSGTQYGLGMKRTSLTWSASSGIPYLKPKDSIVTVRRCSSPVPKSERIFIVSSCTFSGEVSMTRSAVRR